MRFAYADPPYLGQCARYDHYHPDGRCWDERQTHFDLIDRLYREFPAGWALSLSVPSLPVFMPAFESDVRICAWVKPFAVFKANVTQAYAWEPVIVKPLRASPREEPTVRDWVAASISLETGTIGAKPPEFSRWLFEFAGLTIYDEFVDLFPGSGAVSRAWQGWLTQMQLGWGA